VCAIAPKLLQIIIIIIINLTNLNNDQWFTIVKSE